MAKLTPDQKKILRRAWKAKAACRPASREAGCAASTALAYFHKLDRDELVDEPGGETKVTDFKVVGTESSKSLEGFCEDEITSEQDAIAFFKVDTSRWYVKRWECGVWRVPMKMHMGQDAGGRRQPDQSKVHTCYKVTIKLELIAPKPVLDGLDAIFAKMEAKAYRFDLPHVAPRETGGVMMEVNIPDLHLGKLCWAPETGNDYDLKIAEEAYDQAVVDLMVHAKTYDPEKIVFLLGSDFFHFDTPRGTTTAGTPLDVDGRFAKMFSSGFQIKKRAIERALESAGRVDVVLVPGNHDAISSYCLARTIDAQFSRDDRVRVDSGPAARKYVKYGVTLLGIAHGNGVKRANLPLLMATERPVEWAATKCREWHLGHLHTSKAFETMSIDENMGVIVRVISSLSGTDAWHFENGFVGNRRAGEAFVYERDNGFVANFVSTACR